jgi:hypothetical protein
MSARHCPDNGLINIFDEAFWVDPWSLERLTEVDRLRARIPSARLHAERAIELIEAAKANHSLRETAALDATELVARRIDFIGLKFQPFGRDARGVAVSLEDA